MDTPSSYSVLQVVPELDAGGVERTVLDVAEALVADGHAAHVVSAGGRLVEPLLDLGAKHYTMEVGSKRLLSFPWRVAALRRLIHHCGADIVHARSRAPAWAAWRAAVAENTPFVTTYHGIYNEGFPGKRRYNSVMARGDRVIANSEFTADHVSATHGTPRSRIAVVPRGVDMDRFDPAAVSGARVEAVRKRWAVPEDANCVLLPGRLTRWKGQTVAVDALARLPDDHWLVCMGDAQGRDSYEAELRAQADQLGVGERLVLPGHEADVPAALLASDVVITPSTDPEAFGRTAAEAQAMGRWVVASAHGGALEVVGEIVGDGAFGTLVAPGDPAALAEAVLARPFNFDRRAARARIEARYSKRALQRGVLAVYADLLAEKSAKGTERISPQSP